MVVGGKDNKTGRIGLVGVVPGYVYGSGLRKWRKNMPRYFNCLKIS